MRWWLDRFKESGVLKRRRKTQTMSQGEVTNKLLCMNNQRNKSCLLSHWCLPRCFAYIPAFGVEFLAESGAKEKTNHRNNSKRVLHFHCTSSSILLHVVRTPHFLFSKSDDDGFSLLLKQLRCLLIIQMCPLGKYQIQNVQKGDWKPLAHHLRHRETQQH